MNRQKYLPTTKALATLAKLDNVHTTGDHSSCAVFSCMAELEREHGLTLSPVERAHWCTRLLDGLQAIRAVYGNK